MIFLIGRRKFIRAVAYLAALCAVFAASGYFAKRAKASYEETLGKVRISSLASLSEYARDVSGGLRLLAVSEGESAAESAAYVCSRSTGALASLGSFGAENTENMTRFFEGVYDFAEDFLPNDANRSAAIRLSDYAQELYYHLSDLSAAAVNGEYSMTEFGSIYGGERAEYFENRLDFSNGSEDEIFSLTAPASAHGSEPKILEGKKSVSAQQAKQTASEAAAVNPALWREKTADGGGYGIYLLTHADTAVEICVSGGIIRRIINPVPCSEKVYGAREAREKAEAFLKTQGFGETELLKESEGDFTASFRFAPSANGVLLMTAVIDIEICLASGNVTYFDASDYIRRYRTDIFAETESVDLSGILPDNLTLRKTVVCLADIAGRERLCRLAVCSFNGSRVRVYVDYQSLKIIKTEI